jgi:hypothetical protein
LRAGGTEESADTWSPQIGLGAPVLIPEEYVPDLNVRMSLYRRLAEIEQKSDIDGFAAELIDRLEESVLADLIHAYGEERLSRRIARRLVAERPWSGSGRSSADLAYVIGGCFPPPARRGRARHRLPRCGPCARSA